MSAAVTESSLADEIAAAFAAFPRPADDELAGGCTCDDCLGDTEPLRGKTRGTAAAEDFYNGRGNVARVLGHEAFLYYLPTVARLALEHQGADPMENMAVGIANDLADEIRARFASSDRWGYGPEHTQAILDRLDGTQRELLVRLVRRLHDDELASPLTSSVIANLTTGRVTSYSEDELARWYAAEFRRRGLTDADGNWVLPE